jgi:UDP-N-acetylglucosamine diphosphorylase/glucosamine-1-phosphate N-acetyltransferase
MNGNVGIVILAAGKGTRMKSPKAKVLHEICGRPMICYVVKTATAITGKHVYVVVGHQAQDVQRVVAEDFNVQFVQQNEQRGTGHAVLCALPFIPREIENVMILCGDVPLISEKTIAHLIADHLRAERDITMLAVQLDNPKGYGRVLFNKERALIGIVEEADADAQQKLMKVINTGIYVVKRNILETALPEIKANNVQKEIYLTDIVSIGYQQHMIMGAVIGDDSSEIIGVNSPVELQQAENLMEIRSSEIY